MNEERRLGPQGQDVAAIRKRTWRTSKGEAKVGWTVDVVDSRGNCERRQFATRREADEFRVTLEGQLRAGTFWQDAARATLREAAALFLTYCEGRMERGERMTRHNLAVYAATSTTTSAQSRAPRRPSRARACMCSRRGSVTRSSRN